MSVPTKEAKSRVEQQLTNVFTRNGDNVTTTTNIVDFSGAKPLQMYSFTKTEPIQAINTPKTST